MSKKEKKLKENKVAEEQVVEKKEKKSGEKSTFSKVMNVILWIVLLLWMAICLIDFYKVHQETEPFFCIDKGVNKYEDGEVKWCLGLGYKVYNYKRDSFRAIEFGPFWSKDRSALEENK